jgi:GEVED domain/Secretion system C-terminal sorting domain
MAVFSAIGIFAQTITVGTGASTSGTNDNGNPIYRSSAGSVFNFSHSVQLYTAADLAALGGPVNLTKVAFFKSSAFTLAAGRTATLKIYLKNSTTSALNGTQTLATWITGATQVYNNPLVGPADIPAVAGFVTFDFSATPFVYLGGNLEVAIDWAMNAGASPASTGAFLWTYDAVTSPQAAGISSNAAITAALTATPLRRYRAQFTYSPLATACSATPLVASISASNSTVCLGGSSKLVAAAPIAESGITYQWQSSSAAAGPFTNISGATTYFYDAVVTSSTYYRLVTGCTPSGLTSNSNDVLVNVSSTPYASIPVNESFENTWLTTCVSAPLGQDQVGANWLSIPQSGNNSWRADNTTIALSGWTGTGGAFTPVFSNGARSARFHTFNSPAGTSGSLDLYVNLSPAGTKQLSFDYINTSGADSIAVLLSTDGGATFSPIASKVISATWAPITASITSTSATCVVRFKAVSDFGTTDIGIDNIVLALPCAGTPNVPVIAASTATFCPGATINFSSTGASTGPGISYQWESSSAAAGPFTSIASATNSTYSFNALSTTTFYRLKTTCANSSLNSVSNVVSVAPVSYAYATVPYFESFENTWLTTCVGAPRGQDQPSVNWSNGLYTGDNSWRADNTSLALSGWTSLVGTYAPAASAGARSAKFHTYDAPLNTTGSLDLYINLSTAGSKQLSFDYINPTGTDSVKVLLSTDGGLTFPTVLTSKKVAAVWTNVTAPIVTSSATCVIRFLALSDYGADDLGIDNVSITLPCSGAPTAGAVSGSTTICSGATTILGLSGATTAPGITYQWLSAATPTGPYSAIGGATASSYTTAAITAAISYRCKVTCTNSSLFDTTAAFTIGLKPSYQCYCAVTNACAPGGSIDSLFITATTLNHAQANCPTTNSTGGDVYPATGNTTASLIAGGTHTIGVVTTSSTIQSVWIDYNQNGIYEATEHTQITTASTTPLTTANLVIPSTATLGLTGMRVRTRFSGNPNGPGDACINMGSGEYADYGVTIIACTTPTVTVNSPSVCIGDSVVLTASGSASNYAWSSGQTTASIKVSPAAAATYTVTNSIVPGCSATATSSVTVNALPIVTAASSADTVCAGTNVTLTGGGATTYTWNNGAVNGIAFAPTATNTYIVTGTDVNGCTDTAQTTVTVNALPTVTASASASAVCAGGTVTLTGGGAASYTWDNGVTDGTAFVPASSTTYTVTGTAANTCTNTASVTVTVNAKPTANLPATISTCNATETLDAGNASLPGVVYLWSNGATTQTTTVSVNGNYSVTVTGTGGCSVSDTVNVTLNSGVATSNVTATSTSICAGTSTTLVGSPSGGVFSANGTGGVFNGTTAGTFDVTYTVTSSCGTAIDTVSITVNANPVTSITPSSPTICAGGTTAVTLTGTPVGGTFSVQSGTASALTGNSFNPAATGTWTIVYSFTNASGCPDTSNINFNVNCTVGLNDITKGVASIQVVPNPTSGNFDLNITNAADKATIKLLSFDGRLLATEKVELNQNNTVKMNIANYANGIYFVNVISGNVNKTIKITKQD